ncbi:adenine-specific DNA-methyltransferase [Pseudooceanicola nitratireducens]|uniref:site-specific DNA-methyltransferase (adenine-specific) n=1 Tax=Pseudooceanicola nitratireducens TaxID=517719 RepID=A0A1I1LV90_9RHOB|nr:adenine-specific DNA-methyltransferase [Pseudooceanicola nitratireducens]
MKKENGESLNIVDENIDALKAILPDAFTEDGIDFDVLRQLLGDKIADGEEKYGLTWHGKKKARQIALAPSSGTLRPSPEESTNWSNTQNLFIEGDNLEVLKLLQRSYANAVKMIYIDPPYNTGGDLIYPDKFQDNLDTYLRYTGQKGEDSLAITSNPEASGRFHTNWLNMIYPRICVSRNLLSSDGVIFVSIDDGELQNLRMIMDEVFGEENFIACFVWKSRQNKDNRTTTGASIDHEYVLCYGNHIRGDKRDYSQYANPDGDPRGDWVSANMVGIATADRRPNLHYDLVNPATDINYGCPTMGWRYDRNTMGRLIEEDRILWPTDDSGRPRRKAFLSELDSEFTGFSTIIGKDIYTRHGTANIDELFDARIFTFPKPVELLTSLIEQGSGDGDIVLDFFAGSGSTAHSVLKCNATNNEHRRFIMVQLPEPLDQTNRDQKTASDFCATLGKPRNIAELSKERIRRAATKIKEGNPDFDGDLGFKVFKLDSSNIRAWNPDASDLEQTLLDHAEHLVEGRSEQDVLYELLLKRGVDLTVPIEEKEIAGKTVYSIGYGVLFACLDETIDKAEIEALAKGITDWHNELEPAADTQVVFRDSAFADDIAKTNMTAILEQNGIAHVRSL